MPKLETVNEVHLNRSEGHLRLSEFARALRARSILPMLEIWMQTQSMLYCMNA